MAALYWQGTTENFNTAANWRVNSVSGSVSGSAPATGDTLYFTQSGVSVTVNPTSAVDAANVYVAPDYTGSLGAPGVPLTNLSSQASFIIRGSGAGFYLGGDVDGTMEFNPANATAELTWSGGTIARPVLQSGRWTIHAATVVTSPSMLGGTGTIHDNATVPTSSIITGGIVDDYRGGPHKVMHAALLRLRGDAALSSGAEIHGRVMDYGTAGTHTSVSILPTGILDISAAVVAKTLNTPTLYDGYRILGTSALGAVTLTSPVYVGGARASSSLNPIRL